MAKIIYFGAEGNGRAGHYPMGIDKYLTLEECKIWTECDNETWIKHHGVVYTNYAVPFSVDDERGGSHTEVFWEGIHSEEEMIELIKSNTFLKKQFKM